MMAHCDGPGSHVSRISRPAAPGVRAGRVAAALMSNALAALFKGVKRPWQITGIASTADYLDYLPGADEYRKHAPGSQPVKAVIPHDVPQFVFNTRYYGRDYRRNNKYSARKVDRTPLDVAAMVASMPLKPEDVAYAERPLLVQDRGV